MSLESQQLALTSHLSLAKMNQFNQCFGLWSKWKQILLGIVIVLFFPTFFFLIPVVSFLSGFQIGTYDMYSKIRQIYHLIKAILHPLLMVFRALSTLLRWFGCGL